MACFIVPAAEAVVTTIVSKVVKSKEKELPVVEVETESEIKKITKLPFSKKLNWLSNLLWGGSALLCYEHLWHGEVIPYFPFLTAAADPTETTIMLQEMATVGGTMAALLTAVWATMLCVSSSIEKKTLKPYLKNK